MTGHETTFTPALASAILKTLREGIPFLAFAAERHGVPRGTMYTWMHKGDEGREPWATFSREVRAIRAEYVLKTMSELSEASKNDYNSAKNKIWMLERLDREVFMPPREVTRVEGERSSAGENGRGKDRGPRKRPAPPTAQALAELEKPEPEQVN